MSGKDREEPREKRTEKGGERDRQRKRDTVRVTLRERENEIYSEKGVREIYKETDTKRVI